MIDPAFPGFVGGGDIGLLDDLPTGVDVPRARGTNFIQKPFGMEELA